MKTLFPFVAFALVLGTTLGAGWYQGSLTNRWGLRSDANRAAESLKLPLPPEVGSWRLRRETPFTDDVVRMLQCPAHISRVYEHQQTGDFVRVAVIVGPPGPVSVHTPEICYSARDYTLDGVRRKLAVKDNQGAEHSLWDLPLNAKDSENGSIRVLYGWSSGTTWEATQRPRFSYGGLPHLYKLQISVPANSAAKATGFDPAQDFLASFLAQLQPYLVKASR